jgi:tetratricopeptide (TPR) repeat protein
MRNWQIAGVTALIVIVVSISLYAVREMQHRETRLAVVDAPPAFVGREQCIECHTEAYESWLGSHHDDAMGVANEATVLGDFDDAEFEYNGVTSRFFRKDDRFFVHTEGPDGEMADFEITHTFGIEPLQQYLVPFPGGRMQALSTAWDTENESWFFLYPGQDIEAGNWLHWTRNGQNWNGMCAECHSTNLRKNFDGETNTFSTEWSEIDVSCEACHGPGSQHVDWANVDPMGRPAVENYALTVDTSDIGNRELVEICAPCHSRRAETGDYDHSQVDLLENLGPSLLADGLYHPDGQILEEVYVWGSFVQSKMYANGVRCDDCHNVHSTKLHQEGNGLCLQCHLADTYDVYEHHFHQHVVDGEPSDGALCVKCHMPEQPFMVIDYRADHSLRVPRPDLSLELGVPNACNSSGCHDDQTVEWSVEHFNTWYGTARKPHFGTILAAARAGDPEAERGLHGILENALYPVIVRATALNALQAYPGDRTHAAVRRALTDDESLLRLTAVDALPEQEPARMAEDLGPLLFDPVRSVRIRTAARLAGPVREYLNVYQREALDRELEAYVESLERSLDFAASGMNLANLYASEGDFEQAKRYYRMALDVDDMFFPAKLNLAVLASQQGDNGEAETLLREVLSDYPEQYDAAYSLALLLVETSRMDEGLIYLARAAQGLPMVSRVQYNYGLLLAQLFQDEEAEAALQRALQLEPSSFEYLYAMIDFYFRRERFDEALVLAERMIEAHPTQRFGYDVREAIRNR